MMKIYGKIKAAISLLSRGNISALLYRIKQEAVSEETSYALRRDLSEPFTPPPASISITVRLFEESDKRQLLGPDGKRGKVKKVRTDSVLRTELIDENIPSCYVAVTEDGSPCFIQWIFPPNVNGKVMLYRSGYSPPLSDNEALIEGAFIPQRYRGKRIMACAMSQVAEKGRDSGARWAITYVETSNVPSLRGCLACGFHPYIIRKVRWRAFRCRVSVTYLDETECRRLEALWRQAPESALRSIPSTPFHHYPSTKPRSIHSSSPFQSIPGQ